MPIRKREKSSRQSTSNETPTRERIVTSLPTRKPNADGSQSYVVYGRSGTGKTTLASTFPGPTLLCDVNDHGDRSATGVTDLEVMDIEDFSDLDDKVYWYLHQNPEKFKTVIIDTITQLQEMRMQQVLDAKKSTKRVGEWGAMTRQEFGAVASAMKSIITKFRNLSKLGINVIFIAQQRISHFDEETDVGLEPEIGPQLMPSIASHLNASVSIIASTFIRESTLKMPKGETKTKIQYCLFLGPNAVRVTKTRKERAISVPSFLIDPTYQDIVDTLKGE